MTTLPPAQIPLPDYRRMSIEWKRISKSLNYERREREKDEI